jgi:hypothetical protein
MPVLTRRRNLEASDECRQIYFGDVRVGTIAIRTGNPHDTDPWEWWCGFYPGSHPREHQSGTAATFDQARGDFEAACSCRTGRKPIFRRGVKSETRPLTNMRSGTPASGCRPTSGTRQALQDIFECPCGEIFNTQRLEETVIHVPHITAATTLH